MGMILGLLVGAGALLVLQAITAPRNTRRPRRRARSVRVDAGLWPDVVDDMSSAIRAGLSLPQAMFALADGGPEDLRPFFDKARASYLASGDFPHALLQVRTMAADPVADKFCAALSVAYQVGGSDLAVVLRTLSEVLRDDIRVRGEIKARQSWTVNGARLAVAAPWVTALLLSTRSDAARVYASPGGIRVLAVCATISIIAYASMVRISRLPQEQVMSS